MIGKNANTLK